jgi:hypothetical protein
MSEPKLERERNRILILSVDNDGHFPSGAEITICRELCDAGLMFLVCGAFFRPTKAGIQLVRRVLSPAQERVLRQAVIDGTYRPIGPRMVSCLRLEEMGLLRGVRGAGSQQPWTYKPTMEGQRWVERRDKEST